MGKKHIIKLIFFCLTFSLYIHSNTKNFSNNILKQKYYDFEGYKQFKKRIEKIKKKRPVIGLVLSGGAARSLANIGVLKEFEKNKIPVDFIVTVSMSSMIALLYSGGMSPDNIRYFMNNINIYDLFSLTLPVNGGIIEIEKLTNTIQEFIKIDSLKKSYPSTIVVCEDLKSKKLFYSSTGNYFKMFSASFALPVYFNPVKYKNYLLVDGGFNNLVPMKVASEFADILIATSCFYNNNKLNLKNPLTILNRVIDSGKTRAALKDFEKYSDVWIKIPVERYSFMDFDKQEEITKLGESETRKHIDKIIKLYNSKLSNYKIKISYTNAYQKIYEKRTNKFNQLDLKQKIQKKSFIVNNQILFLKYNYILTGYLDYMDMVLYKDSLTFDQFLLFVGLKNYFKKMYLSLYLLYPLYNFTDNYYFNKNIGFGSGFGFSLTSIFKTDITILYQYKNQKKGVIFTKNKIVLPIFNYKSNLEILSDIQSLFSNNFTFNYHRFLFYISTGNFFRENIFYNYMYKTGYIYILPEKKNYLYFEIVNKFKFNKISEYKSRIYYNVSQYKKRINSFDFYRIKSDLDLNNFLIFNNDIIFHIRNMENTVMGELIKIEQVLFYPIFDLLIYSLDNNFSYNYGFGAGINFDISLLALQKFNISVEDIFDYKNNKNNITAYINGKF